MSDEKHTGPTPERAEKQHPNSERRDSHGSGQTRVQASSSDKRREWMEAWAYVSKH